MPDRLRTKGWGKKFVDDAPLFGIGVAEEDAGLFVLDRVQRVVFVDHLGEELALCEHDTGEGGVVGLIDGPAHGGCLEHWAVQVEQTLVVSEMVWVGLKIGAKIRHTLGPRHFSDLSPIHADGDGFCCSQDILN